MSWTCPHCDKELDPETLKFGVVLGDANRPDSASVDENCSHCTKPIRIQFIAQTSYRPYAVDKRAQLTLVNSQEI